MNKTLHGFYTFINNLHPLRIVAFGYMSYIAVGWLVLTLPFCHYSETVTALDSLFTSTSAVSTTGLVTVSISKNFNLLGQIVVLILIQLGGIGYITFGSFVVLSRSSFLSEHRQQIGKAVFSMPDNFELINVSNGECEKIPRLYTKTLVCFRYGKLSSIEPQCI